MGLEIEIAEMGQGGRRVALGGRLDTQTAPLLDERLAPLLESSSVTAVLFDLAHLAYISSAGIRSLVRARRALEARGGGVAVAHLQPPVRAVFEIVKALPSVDVFADDAELDAYLEAMQRRGRP
jgi:anti-anti-sigma factor